MPLGIFHYQILTRVLEGIHFIYDEKELADSILETVSTAMNAEGGSIFRVERSGDITPLASFGAPLEVLLKLEFKKGKGVVGWVAEYGQPVKVDDPKRDQRFMEGADQSTGFKTKSILAAPILAKGQVVGIIEFLNRKDGPFAAPDLELISVLGREIGIAFENAELIRRLDKALAFQRAVLDSLSAGILVVDSEGRLLRANPRAKKILGLSHLGKIEEGNEPDFHEVLVKYPPIIAVLNALLEGGEMAQRKEFELEIMFQPKWIGYSTMPVKGFQDKIYGYALLFQDITDLKRSASSSEGEKKT